MTTESELTFSPKWNARYMALAQHIATWSGDTSTHVGCVVVGPDKEVRATGYNGFPRGVNDEIAERFNRPLKYAFTEHAERNAIYNAALYNASLKNCVMYVTLPSCPDCARAIIQSGIKEVIAMAAPSERSKTNPEWDDAIDISKQMFHESGVKYFEMPNPIDNRYNPLVGDMLFNSNKLNTLSQNLISKFGFAYEATICMEEITELMTEWILDNSPENLAAETADVIITMNHIITGYNIRPQVSDRVNSIMVGQNLYATKSDRMIALLKWQKELIKNINRHKDNRNQIISKTAGARAAIITDIISRDNIAAVQHHINQKIERTIERAFGEKTK